VKASIELLLNAIAPAVLSKSRAQIHLYEEFVRAGARIICVSDPAQAIQGFAGADHQAWEKLRGKFEAIDLRLSECFRCDAYGSVSDLRAIIALAQKIIPDIEPRKDAGEGEVKVLAKEKITGRLTNLPTQCAPH